MNARSTPPVHLSRQLRQLVSGLDDGIVLVELDQTISWANERALALHGVSHIADLGATVDEYRKRFHVTYRNKRPVKTEDFPVERAAKGERPREVTVMISPIDEPNDSWTHDLRCFVIYDADDRPSFMVLVIDDETDRYAAEDRFESAFRANPAPALICRLSDLRFVRVNAGFLEMTGYRSDELIGTAAHEFDIFAGCEDRERIIELLKAGRTIPQNPTEIALPDGGRKHVIVAGQPIRVGKEHCMLFTFADIEPRRRAEAALRASEERFSKAFTLSPIALAIASLDRFEFADVNDAFTVLTGLAKEQALGRSGAELRLWHHTATQQHIQRAIKESGTLAATDVRLRASDGSPIECSLTAGAIAIGEAACVLLVFHDITERKRSEEELIEAIEAVMTDASWFSRSIVEKLASFKQMTGGTIAAAGLDTLSDRERDVLGLICQGRNDKQMSETLHLSPHTIRNHVGSLYRKIGVGSRSEAVVWARERGVTGPTARKPAPKKG
ncbi:helix-turn-helix transcriptional regulator [Aureimonas leprariae]|uniref:Helix-turn-helix transcriptional regulator n=1 Tax=Plantimonas leprariae TaxID=2615207 RepID=A0A7V7TYI3_9HYPH|nr:PAS domain S-box protein [Aureimonas leprariae]KAB0682752.1 helix-turn-helix transcriptional regulator [Aureimonas leprariae]